MDLFKTNHKEYLISNNGDNVFFSEQQPSSTPDKEYARLSSVFGEESTIHGSLREDHYEEFRSLAKAEAKDDGDDNFPGSPTVSPSKGDSSFASDASDISNISSRTAYRGRLRNRGQSEREARTITDSEQMTTQR